MKYDVIVIGGGTNGLAAAGLLAKAGRRAVVVEQRDRCGGLTGSEEFPGGYRVPGVLHDTSGIRHRLLAPLALERHGLRVGAEPPAVFAPQKDGPGLLLHHDPARAASAIEAFSARDATAYAGFREFIDSVRGFVNEVLDSEPLDATTMSRGDLWRAVRKGAALRRLGRRRMLELLRVGPMSVADWLGEWFESDLLKTLLAGPAVHGSFLGPRSPGSATNLLVYECRKGPTVEGGAGAFADALERAAIDCGAEIRKSARVERIRVNSGAVEGVDLAGGGSLDAHIVVATCDPAQTFLKLLDGGAISETFAHRMRKYRALGTSAKVNIALSAPPALGGRSGDAAEIVRTGERLDDLEKAFDALKYGRYSDRPVLDIYIPRGGNSAPDGHSVMSVLVNFAPYELKDGWNAQHRDAIGEKVIALLEELSPGIAGSVSHLEVLTPREIETRYGLSGGHILHGDHQLDQLLSRPCPECARYSTPIGGLFACGSGSHPGGGVTCAPGALGAKAVLASR